MPLRDSLSNTWAHIQANLFPWLAEELGPLTEKHKQLITVLEVARIEAFVSTWSGLPGRPPHDRAALARAFVAKAVIGLPTTSMLIDRLAVDKRLRRLCGWERPGQVPSESTFSRAFAEFAESELPSRVHEALIKTTHAERLVGHISRDGRYPSQWSFELCFVARQSGGDPAGDHDGGPRHQSLRPDGLRL